MSGKKPETGRKMTKIPLQRFGQLVGKHELFFFEFSVSDTCFGFFRGSRWAKNQVSLSDDVVRAEKSARQPPGVPPGTCRVCDFFIFRIFCFRHLLWDF